MVYVARYAYQSEAVMREWTVEELDEWVDEVAHLLTRENKTE